MANVNTEEVRVVVSPYRICPLGAHIDHQVFNNPSVMLLVTWVSYVMWLILSVSTRTVVLGS